MCNLKYSSLIKLGLVGAVLYVAIGSDLFETLRKGFAWSFLVGALVVQPIILFCLVVLSLRHVVLVGVPKVRLRVAFRAMVLSQGLNLMLPARLSELLKATYLRDHAGVPLSVGLSAVVLERTVDVFIVAGLGVLGLAQFFDRGNFAAFLIMGVACIFLMLLLIRSKPLVIRLVRALPSARLAGFVERAYLHFTDTARTPAFWRALLLGIVGWGASYINILVFIELAGSISVGFSGALLVFVLTTLGAAVPALPGGVGTYEAAAVIAFRALGYPFDEALALSIAMHATQLALPFILAVLIMLTERLGLSSLIADLRVSTKSSVQPGSPKMKANSHD